MIIKGFQNKITQCHILMCRDTLGDAQHFHLSGNGAVTRHRVNDCNLKYSGDREAERLRF
jgi:hypothetical protein